MRQPVPIAQDLVLIGGGHAHVHVLKRFVMHPADGVRLTLIARDVETPYSGMLPGYVAGQYSFAECHIDLVRLARLDDVPGAAEHTVSVKPISHFAACWEALLERAQQEGHIRLAIVGGGAGGVELALSAQHRLRGLLGTMPEVTLVTREGLLPSHNEATRRRFGVILGERGIRTVTENPIQRVEPGHLIAADGSAILFDEALWVTEAAGAPWLAET